MRTVRRALVPIFALLALVYVRPAHAQGGVEARVDAGYDGYYGAEGTTPIRVVLVNAGPSFRARVEMSAPVAGGRVLHYAEVELPRGSRKAVTLLPQLTSLATKAEVRMLRDGQLVARGTDTLSRLESNDRLWGVLAPDTGAYAPLSSRTEGADTAVALLALRNVPDRPEALLEIDTLVVDGVRMDGISEPQRTALRAWVELGGTLVVTGGPDAAGNAAGLERLLPVTLGAAREAPDLAALAPLAGGTAPPRGGVIVGARPVAGARVIAGTDALPLIVSRPLGRGAVTWLAWSPTAPPFRGWNGAPALLRSVGGGGVTRMQPLAAGLNEWDLRPVLTNIAGAQLPPISLLAAFLLGYTLLLGPGLYMVLKRRDRRELAWVLIPAITLVFSGLAYGANFLIRGVGTTLRTIEIVETEADAATRRVTAFAGLFSPTRRSYDIALPPGASARSASGEAMGMDPSAAPPGPGPLFTVEAGQRPLLRGFAVDVYALRTFAADRVEASKPPPFETRVEMSGRRFEGELRPLDGAAFEDVYYLTQRGVFRANGRDGVYRIDGAAQQVTGEWMGDGPPPGWERQQVIQALERNMAGMGPMGPGTVTTQPLGPNELLVLAWQRGVPSALALEGAAGETSAERLWIVRTSAALRPGPVSLVLAPRLRPPMADAGGAVSELRFAVPDGVTARSLRLRLDEAAYQSLMGGGMMGVEMDPGMPGVEAVATAPLPPAPDLAEGAETPVAPSGAPSGLASQIAKVEVMDASGRWIDVTGAVRRTGATGLLEPAGPYVRDGEVVVRVTNPSGDLMLDAAIRLELDGRKR